MSGTMSSEPSTKDLGHYGAWIRFCYNSRCNANVECLDDPALASAKVRVIEVQPDKEMHLVDVHHGKVGPRINIRRRIAPFKLAATT